MAHNAAMARDHGIAEAYDRRTWRLAYLLTGNATGAALLVDRIRRDQPNLEQLEPARLDRVVIQHARELPPRRRTPVAETPSLQEDPAFRKALDAVLTLPEQPREAWILSRVDQVDELHMSRAMDCSRTAARLHLAAADQQMSAAFDAGADAAAARIRAVADTLDPAPIIAAHRAERRRQRKQRAMYIGGAAIVSLLIIALALLQRWFF
jgi:hypothetical protein